MQHCTRTWDSSDICLRSEYFILFTSFKYNYCRFLTCFRLFLEKGKHVSSIFYAASKFLLLCWQSIKQFYCFHHVQFWLLFSWKLSWSKVLRKSFLRYPVFTWAHFVWAFPFLSFSLIASFILPCCFSIPFFRTLCKAGFSVLISIIQ